jgi:hypothetical protein
MADALHDRLSLRHPHHRDEEIFNSAVSWRPWSGMPFSPDDEWPQFKTSAAGGIFQRVSMNLQKNLAFCRKSDFLQKNPAPIPTATECQRWVGEYEEIQPPQRDTSPSFTLEYCTIYPQQINNLYNLPSTVFNSEHCQINGIWGKWIQEIQIWK